MRCAFLICWNGSGAFPAPIYVSGLIGAGYTTGVTSCIGYLAKRSLFLKLFFRGCEQKHLIAIVTSHINTDILYYKLPNVSLLFTKCYRT